jgi:hypothetical protein
VRQVQQSIAVGNKCIDGLAGVFVKPIDPPVVETGNQQVGAGQGAKEENEMPALHARMMARRVRMGISIPGHAAPTCSSAP